MLFKMLFYNSAVFSFKILLHILLPLDRRLNATLHKKLHAHHDVACVEKCVDDTCCRSVNFLKTLDGKKMKTTVSYFMMLFLLQKVIVYHEMTTMIISL